jgi:hypothetical protein
VTEFKIDFITERIIVLFRVPRPSLGARLVGAFKHRIGTCLTSNYFDYHHHLSFDLQYQLVKKMGRRPDYHIAQQYELHRTYPGYKVRFRSLHPEES